ncbi:MAG TPA: hypothetical protein ENH85_06200 [Candidatus Scalindua sp.]|nr:hypothetical protein [Candidatus Scalindua sp.]
MVAALVIIGYLVVGFVVGVVWNIIDSGDTEATCVFCLFGWPVVVPIGLVIFLTKKVLGE